MKQRRLLTSLAAAALLAVPCTAIAQPEGDKGGAVQTEAPAKERVESRIAKSLEDVERIRAWLLERRERLNAGESPQRIAAELEIAARMLAGAGRSGADGRGWRGEGSFQDRGPERVGERGPERGQAPDRGEDAEIPPFDRDRTIAFLREHMPRLARRMDELQERDAAMTDRFLARMAPRLREIESVRRRDPVLFGLRVAEFQTTPDVVDAMRLYREALAGKTAAGEAPITVEAAEARLRDALRQQFEARLAVQRHELETLQSEVARLEKDMAEKQSRQSSYIDEAIERMRSGPDRGRRDGDGRGDGRGGDQRGPDDRRPPR